MVILRVTSPNLNEEEEKKIVEKIFKHKQINKTDQWSFLIKNIGRIIFFVQGFELKNVKK